MCFMIMFLCLDKFVRHFVYLTKPFALKISKESTSEILKFSIASYFRVNEIIMLNVKMI